MEETDVGQSLATDEEKVRARLKALEDLLGVLDRQFTPLSMVMDRQSTAMWTSIPSCASFGSQYSDRLARLQRGLLGIRAQLAGLQSALAASAQSLARTDQDIQDRLTALAAKLADVPVAPEVVEPPLPLSVPGSGGGTW